MEQLLNMPTCKSQILLQVFMKAPPIGMDGHKN